MARPNTKLDPQLIMQLVPHGDPPWIVGVLQKGQQIRLAEAVLARDLAMSKADVAFKEAALSLLKQAQ